MLPIGKAELVVGGLTAEKISVGSKMATECIAAIFFAGTTRIALRVRGTYRGKREEVAACTSAVQVLVRNQPICAQ